MKKFVILISFLFVGICYSQTLLLEENFSYTDGELTTVSANWSESPTGSFNIKVLTGNLTYTDYPSSGIGSKITLDGGATGRSGVNRSFTTQSTDGSTVYFSFLMNVINTDDMDINTSNGDYFVNFQNSGASVTRGNIYVRKGASASKFSIGVIKTSSASLMWHSTELDIGTTYLIVVAYSFISGSGNDAVKLWINADLSGTEPSADITITSGTDAADLGFIQFRQQSLSGDIDIDGLRVADSWSQAPLPVELSSFSTSKIEGGVQLNWITETEINNYGFEIERAKGSETQNPDYNWSNIGFVPGYGNSNSSKNYFFNDLNVQSGKCNYRLKQIDNDGIFTYSKIIHIDVNAPFNYELGQNYPNPFNPLTTIKFNLHEAGKVRLTVFNSLGEEVKTLINRNMVAGTHTVNFISEGLMSGIYFYRFVAAEFIQVKKMILMK